MLTGQKAFFDKHYNAVVVKRAASRPQKPAIGGTHTQSGQFDRMTIDAASYSGHLDTSESIQPTRLAAYKVRSDASRNDRLPDHHTILDI